MLTSFSHRVEPSTWSWDQVRRALASRGVSLADIARSLGISRQAVLHVRDARNIRVQAAIGAAIGLAPQLIWPTRYTADGLPIRKPRGRRVRAEAA